VDPATSLEADVLRVVLGVLGLAVTGWVLVPAFQGPAGARKALGTHRLAVGSVVAVVVLSVLIALPLRPFLHTSDRFTTLSFALAALATDIPMLIVIYFRLILPRAVTWQELGLRALPLGYALRMGLGFGVAGFVFTAIVELLLSRVGLRPNQMEQFGFVLSEGPLALAVLLILGAGVVPFVEELFFRGFLFGMYRKRQPMWVAYLASSVLFTLLHIDPTRMNAPQIAGLAVGVFLLAMLLAWLYQHTGSLFPGILAHAVNNATSLTLFYVASTYVGST
jgi:membrane protease YdiL (CAAX protease family)